MRLKRLSDLPPGSNDVSPEPGEVQLDPGVAVIESGEAQPLGRESASEAGTLEGHGRQQQQHVLESQRARLLGAMGQVVAERGLRGASAAQVAKRAGVSRATFAQQFGTLDDCFLAMLDWMLGRATALAAEAFDREPSWEAGALAGLEALLVFLDTEPVCARAGLLESMTGFPSGFQSRAQVLGRLGRLVDAAARQQLAPERQPLATMPEAMVASVLGILRRRLLSGEAPPFVGLLGQLTEVVVAPYLDPSAAWQVASRGQDRAQALLEERLARPVPVDVEVPSMLRHASAHRMRECVCYLAENPEASNQAVAAGIGISHSGQVSILLARLHDAGLLVKECGGAGRPNAWRLSPCGAEVAEVLHRRRASGSANRPDHRV